MMIVLDTDIVTLISYGRNEKIRNRLESVRDEEVAISVITYMEILQGRFEGIKKAANSAELIVAMERFQSSRDLVNSFQFLPVDETAAMQFEEMIKKKKPKMKRGDMLIACITLAHDALLVTRNVKDYQGVTGLRIENWVD